MLENGAHMVEGEGEEERRRRKGHMKTSSISERDRKIGHRRVNEAGQVSYKKVETNALMGSIQLGIHDSVGGLAKYPERLFNDLECLFLVPCHLDIFCCRKY